MKWLSDLIENNTSSLEMLPVPCLCELFMIQCHTGGSHDPDNNTEQQAAHRMHYKRKKTTNEKVSGVLRPLVSLSTLVIR